MIVHQVQELNSVSVLMVTAIVTIVHHAYTTALSVSMYSVCTLFNVYTSVECY
jgi:hypothetical protein